MAAAAVTLFASCAKEETGTIADKNMGTVTIKVAGVNASETRAIEAPGSTTTGTIQLDATKKHRVFVLNATGGVIHTQELAQATLTTGEILKEEVESVMVPKLVPNDSEIYVFCNISSAESSALAAKTTLAAIKAYESDITAQTDYTKPALSNRTSNSQALVETTAAANGNPAQYTATITIAPLISRLELVSVKGGADIISFNVAGVYVDDYYSNFNFGGLGAGTLFYQAQGTTYTGNAFYKDETVIASAGAKGAAVAQNPAVEEEDRVWAYNVAPSIATPFKSTGTVGEIGYKAYYKVPRLLIKLTDVKYTNKGEDLISEEDDTTETKDMWLTITGYGSEADGANFKFERGKIYRIGTSENAFEFNPGDGGGTPNPTNVQMTVKVTIAEWVLDTPDAHL